MLYCCLTIQVLMLWSHQASPASVLLECAGKRLWLSEVSWFPTVLVVGALLFRMIRRLSEAYKGKITAFKSLFEGLGRILIIKDSVYLVMNSPISLANCGFRRCVCINLPSSTQKGPFLLLPKIPDVF
ncbi:hypothetical protein EZV62_010137 [Acer yangbiense]|uniref:Uncharacterized protein n=1 Tax=Acer yangbiense TaxID=1000413 RepID=A0A5C7I0S7_9ROSI|nr:hypothetical protein EZV62_010137 [Acer yangbiense]